MTRLHQLLLVATTLTAPALGEFRPGNHPKFRPCNPGTKICHENTVYGCSAEGKWVGNIQCIPPAHCFEDVHTKDATCVDSNEELKRFTAPAPTPAPSLSRAVDRKPPLRGHGHSALTQAATLTPTATQYGAFPLKQSKEEYRCNGKSVQKYDDMEGWKEVQRCSECFTNSDGGILCTPTPTKVKEVAAASQTPCKINTFRCSGKWEEVCIDGANWERLEKCLDCRELEEGIVNCAPDNLPSMPKPVCHEGSLRCTGDYLETCDSDRQWHYAIHCARCLDDGNGVTHCQPLTALPDAVQTAAPTKPAATPTVPRMTATPAAIQTPAPAPALPSTLIPSVVPKSATLNVDKTKDNPCFGGEVKCNDSRDRMSVCSSSHIWTDFGPCPNCTMLYNTKINCTWDNDIAEQAADNAKADLSQFTTPIPPPA
ncbi:hypothetical protein F4805DRAFT_461778 [Annulohypoxylon moriforme]|nr:hypothetical protein F4805DRAFT_461778 [Annulohypoxylon moriforme]